MQVHRAYTTPTAASVATVTSVRPPLSPAIERFHIKITNLSAKRPISITHTWVESLDPTKHPVQIINPVRPLPARLGPDDQYETWVPVREVPEPELGVEWRFRVQLTSGKVIKSRPNRRVPPSGFVAGGGETVYSAALPTEEPFAVTGVNTEDLKRLSFGPTVGPSATYHDELPPHGQQGSTDVDSAE